MIIAVTGATGQLGRLVIAALKQWVAIDDIVALARSPDKAGKLGVSVRPFDYATPDGLADALSGIGTLLLISSSEVGQRSAQHRNVIAAAKQAGVGRIVYTSLLHADTSSLDLAVEHRDTEAALAASGIPVTLLRNGWYTENYTGAIPGALAAGALIGSAGQGRISSASRADYAEAAAIAASAPDHVGKIYELAGDHGWTLADLAAEVTRQTGRDIAYDDLPPNDYAHRLQDAGLPAGVAQTIAGYDVAASKGALFDNGRQLSRLIGRPTTSLADAVRAALT